MFKNIKSFAYKGSFEGWVRRIMVRESIDFLRSQKHINCFEDLENRMQLSVESNYEHSEEEYLQSLIDALPEGYNLVFNLHAIEGYKHKEVAAMLNISIGTSKSQLAKARGLLQKRLRAKKNYGEYE